jgi:hypothetical protein
MDLPEMRVLMTVCQHEGEGLPELAASVVSRHAMDLTTPEIVGDIKFFGVYGLIDIQGEGRDRKYCLTPKGVAFRDRLLDPLVGAA